MNLQCYNTIKYLSPEPVGKSLLLRLPHRSFGTPLFISIRLSYLCEAAGAASVLLLLLRFTSFRNITLSIINVMIQLRLCSLCAGNENFK